MFPVIGQFWCGVLSIVVAAAPGAGNDELKPLAVRDNSVALTPDSTRIEFVGTHVGPTPDPNARLGHFGNFQGRIGVDVAQGTITDVELEIVVESLATFNPNLTNHLLSPDFFDSKTHALIKFKSTEIRPGDDSGTAVVVGRLEMLGTNEPLEIAVKYSVAPAGLTLAGEMTLRRSQHGMSKMLERVNDNVIVRVYVGRPTDNPNEKK